jgi:hypothetical protein
MDVYIGFDNRSPCPGLVAPVPLEQPHVLFFAFGAGGRQFEPE